MTPVLLGLGANLGDRAANLQAAIRGLGRFLNVLAVSPVYETPPMYDTDQPAFLNLVLTAQTGLTPAALLAAVKQLEVRLGRVPSRRFGPRVIDIDILLFDGRIIREPALEIPHPRLAERAFVLVPAAAVAPDWRHPADGRTLREMCDALGPVSDLHLFNSNGEDHRTAIS